MDDNFKFFALAYLNDWWQYDRNFVLGLSPSRDRNGRASRLSEAATYYDIIRRFPEGSMPQFLDLVDATFGTMGPLGTHNVDLVMTALAELFNQVFKRGVEISSASKFLWWKRRILAVARPLILRITIAGAFLALIIIGFMRNFGAGLTSLLR